MRASLDDLAFIQHDDFVGAHNGRQPVCDHKRGAVARNALERVLNFFFGVAVQGGRRLVKDQDRRPLQDCARDRDALLFAARQFKAAFPDFRFIAFGSNTNERIDLREARRLLYFGIGCSQRP